MDQEQRGVVPFTCVVCDGVLTIADQQLYQCPRGHVATLQDLMARPQQTIQSLAWALERLMEEYTQVSIRLEQQGAAPSSVLEQQLTTARTAVAIGQALLQACKQR